MIHRSKWKPVLKALAVFVILAAGAEAPQAADQAVMLTKISDLRNAGSKALYWGKAALDCARATRRLRSPGEEEGEASLAAAASVNAFLARAQAYQTTNRQEMVRVRWDTEEKWAVAQEAFAECSLRRLVQDFDAEREPLGTPAGGVVVVDGGGGGGSNDD